MHFDLNNSSPYYLQLYNYYKNEILSGRLTKGTKLPSSRALCSDLALSRNTVNNAYMLLVDEGYAVSMEKRGYFVNDIGDLALVQHSNEEPCDSDKETISNKVAISSSKSTTSKTYIYDFSPFSIDLDHFPYTIWQKLSKECMYNTNTLFLSGDSCGDISLRKSIKAYLSNLRGVECDYEQIIIGAGADYLLSLLCQMFDNSLKIAFEDPTYTQATKIFEGFGYTTLQCPLDDNGIDLNVLSMTDANMCYVMPSHQFPTGIVMPVKRRLELIKWAAKTGSYIIEDDHDSEFRYNTRPVKALYGLDTNERTIYMGTFSKSIAPGLRTGFMVLPKSLLKVYQNKVGHYACPVSGLNQAVLSQFINQGYFERHLNRMKKLYHIKHDFMLSCFEPYSKLVTIAQKDAGHYIVVSINSCPLSQKQVIEEATNRGLKLYPMSDYSKDKKFNNVYLFGFGNISEANIYKGIEEFISIISN